MSSYRAHLGRAIIALAEGEPRSALGELELAHDAADPLAPDHELLLVEIDTLRIEAWEAVGEPRRAVGDSAGVAARLRSLGRRVDAAHLELRLARLHLELNQPEDAVLILESARDEFDDLADIRPLAVTSDRLARTYALVGKRTEAIEQYRAALTAYHEVGMTEAAQWCALAIDDLSTHRAQLMRFEPTTGREFE